MIGYNTLGTNGRLGNQMFQYASLRGIADKHGYDFCIPPEDHPTYADYALFLAFKMEGIKTGLLMVIQYQKLGMSLMKIFSILVLIM